MNGFLAFKYFFEMDVATRVSARSECQVKKIFQKIFRKEDNKIQNLENILLRITCLNNSFLVEKKREGRGLRGFGTDRHLPFAEKQKA